MILSPEDRDLAIRTLFGEAATDPASQAAVAAVILNRANQSKASVKDVVLAPKQFEPWGSRKQELLALDPNSQDYKNLGLVIDALASGSTPDPTGGATMFYSPETQKGLGRKAPKWATGDFQDIGAHRFYKGAFPTPKGGVTPTMVAELNPGMPLKKPAAPPMKLEMAKAPISPDIIANVLSGLGGGEEKKGSDNSLQLAQSMAQSGVPLQHIAVVTGWTVKNGKWVQSTQEI